MLGLKSANGANHFNYGLIYPKVRQIVFMGEDNQIGTVPGHGCFRYFVGAAKYGENRYDREIEILSWWEVRRPMLPVISITCLWGASRKGWG